MKYKFLSDDWFTGYGELSKDVVVPEQLAAVCANLEVNCEDGTIIEARFEGGFIRKGYSAEASSTIRAPRDIIYTAIVLGDIKAAMPAVFTGKLKIDGDKAGLIKLGMTPQTESQLALTAKLSELTES